MTKEEIIKDVIKSLIKATENDIIIWSESKNSFSDQYKKGFKSKSDDGLTEFSLKIEISNDFKSYKSLLSIKNDSLIDYSCQTAFFFDYEYKDVVTLGKILYDKFVKEYCEGKIINEEPLDSWNNILKSIDLSEYRDKKIDDIIK